MILKLQYAQYCDFKDLGMHEQTTSNQTNNLPGQVTAKLAAQRMKVQFK
jgi:hypothetical protein